MEVVTVAPDHDYCVIPETGERASVLTEENEALRLQIRELQHQVEVLQLRQRFGIERLVGSDCGHSFLHQVCVPLAFHGILEIGGACREQQDGEDYQRQNDGICQQQQHSLSPNNGMSARRVVPYVTLKL